MRKLLTYIAFLLVSTAATAQQKNFTKQILRTNKAEFFKTDEAKRIGDQVLLWQRCTGGWPKNVDMTSPMTEEQRQQVIADKQKTNDSTTDNFATTLQMTYLARLYQGTLDTRYRDAFRQAVNYLLSGQYKDGGWPQFWPTQRGYQIHITYNDDAMLNTMVMLRNIYNGIEPYGGDLCDEALRKRIKKAFDKGVECILATQIRTDKNGKVLDPKKKNADAILTIWCQQHDRDTYLPAKARAYELPSYGPAESAGLVRLLMELPNPDKRVKAAIHGAMAWFDKYKLTGVKVINTFSSEGKKTDTKLVRAENATPLWGRYYDLESCTPYVCDRDGVPRRSLDEIGLERRNGYGWYTNGLVSLYKIYEKWAQENDPENKVSISLDTKGANENGTIDYDVATVFTPTHINGEPWMDTNGNHINAHGGNIILHNSKYYWYGENRPFRGDTTEEGISAYSSTDLRTWKDEGVVLPVSKKKGHDIEKGCIMERPKVVFCPKTGKFVMLFHLELKGQGYAAARVAFAESDSPTGPFRFIRSQRIHQNQWPYNMTEKEIAKAKTFTATDWDKAKWWTPEWQKAVGEGMFLWRDMQGGQMSRDMTVFVDDDGKAYHITSSQENLTLLISELTDDFLNYTGKYVMAVPGGQNEAPVIFKRVSRYWMICSGCTGWAPNEARMFTAKSIWGPWEQLPSPFTDANGKGFHGMGAEKTFGAQGTYIIEPEKGKYIFMADIWNPQSLRNSLHLWLPVNFKEDGTPVIPWAEKWD